MKLVNEKSKDIIRLILASYHYDYNSLHQLTKITDNLSNTYNFAYDNAGRLTHEDKLGSQGFSRDYTYDFSGNRLTEIRDGVSITYSYNSANQVTSRTSSSESISYSYNNNGNLIQETSTLSGTKTYSYDFEDRLVIARSASDEAIYTYSGDGRRTSSNVNNNIVKYIYDGQLPLIERDSSNNTLVTYTKNPFSLGGIGGLISSYDNQATTLYYHDSNLGNVNQITNSSGAVIQTYDYDAFGNITSQSGSLTTKYAYKTKEYQPETGLIYFGARYYNPLIGRFITKDPSGMVDGPNVYIYLNNDPINGIDPWGLTQEDIDYMLSVVKETQTDLNVPDKVYTIPLLLEGSAITNPFNKTVSIDNHYLKELSEQEKQNLLETLIHESIHRTKPTLDMWFRPFIHPDIESEARRRRLELEKKYPDLYKDKQKMNEKTKKTCNDGGRLL